MSYVPFELCSMASHLARILRVECGCGRAPSLRRGESARLRGFAHGDDGGSVAPSVLESARKTMGLWAWTPGRLANWRSTSASTTGGVGLGPSPQQL